MKVYSFFEKYVLVLLGILVFASCSDDDNAGVMSSKVMLNQELVASNYSFIWNGVTSPRKDDVKAKFEASETLNDLNDLDLNDRIEYFCFKDLQ